MKREFIRISKYVIGSLLLSVTYAVAWYFIFGYTTQEITELQAIPLILQGGTDWGGSNIFAAYVSGHFFFGIFGCILLTEKLLSSNPQIISICEKMLYLFLSSFVIANALILTGELENGHWRNSFPANYILCQYLQVAALFLITSLFSVLLIAFIAKSPLPFWIRRVLSPIFFILFVWFGSSGITPKAGQNLNAGDVPLVKANSERHRILLKLHSCCRDVIQPWDTGGTLF